MNISTSERKLDPRINHAPVGFKAESALTKSFYSFLNELHVNFTPRQKELVTRREKVLRSAFAGDLPDHDRDEKVSAENWKIKLPDWCADQRNQMTGPADDGALVVKMLNSGAPGVMIDLEDSMANNWENLEIGIGNSLKALSGGLTYCDKKRDQEVSIRKSPTVIWVRVRGLHLNQGNVISDELMSASVYDVARIAYGVDRDRLQNNLCFYIPKSESAEEALFWRDLFQAVEEKLGWEKGFIKCMALVESHSLAYQMEEFIYNLRDHILGLNLGRWDYMASLIHFNLQDPDWVLPDRNTIPSDVAFFQNLRELLVELCHKHGLLAIGGMTALFPSRHDKALNTRALSVLEADKKNESGVGMDGAWTGHPDQNDIAVAQFPAPNQNFKTYAETQRYPDLRPLPRGIGKYTLNGTRDAVRTVIRYRQGVLAGKGASLLDGYMEDLATDRIYRLMIAQRVIHRQTVKIFDDKNQLIVHDPEFTTKIFDEELTKLLGELPDDTPESVRQTYIDARIISEEMITSGQFDPI